MIPFWWLTTSVLVLDKAGVVMVAFVDLYCCKQRSRVCPPQQIGICLRHKGLLPSLQRIRAKLLTSSSVLDTDAKVALTPELQLASFQIKIGWLDPRSQCFKINKTLFLLHNARHISMIFNHCCGRVWNSMLQFSWMHIWIFSHIVKGSKAGSLLFF